MPKRLPTWLTEVERDRLLGQSLPVRDRAILSLFLYAGLRCNELRMLDVTDLDFDSMLVHVRHAKRGKERWVPLHAEAAAALDQYLDGRAAGAVFISRRGERISNRQLRTLVKGYGRSAGLRKSLHPHALRHTFAVALKDLGEDLETIRDLLGHEDIRTTSIYLHCSMAGKRRAIERL